MDGGFIMVLAFVVVSAGLFATSARLRRSARLKRELRGTEVTAIAELAENVRGKVSGAAQPLEKTLRAPITGRECVYYVVTVEQERSSGDSTSWETLVEDEAGVPFRLVDDSGQAIVDPQSASVALTVDGFDIVCRGQLSHLQEQFLLRSGLGSARDAFKLRFHEAVIEVGERVSVLGEGVREPDPSAASGSAGGYRDGAPTRLRLTSSSRFPLKISDDPSTLE